MRLKTVRLVLLLAVISGLLPHAASASTIVLDAVARGVHSGAEGNLVWFDGPLTTTSSISDSFIFAGSDDRTSRSRLEILDLTAIPEPASMLLLGAGLIGVSLLRLRRRA